MERENESLNEGFNDAEKEVKKHKEGNLNESMKKETKKDVIHRYVYLEDLDGNEIPAWNFTARIATAEDVEEGVIFSCALDHGYKIFHIDAPGFYREIVAAKEIKADDIQEEYADFLQGKAFVTEIKTEDQQ